MSDDRLVEILLFGLGILHVGALYDAVIRRHGLRAIRLLNLLVSAGIVAWWAPSAGKLLSGYYIDEVVAVVAFELSVLIVSILAMFRLPIPGLVIGAAFVAHCVLIGLALAFMFTFQMRMF